ncbi:MAG: hypothetical protein CVU77_07140 [Elusimicrobia bacterium HGW-Elusimicrobia-1]|jgi:competence protein ComEC|nr:MAG: hypothetical protein CVU77_07140 [Elusimicrobia bacterium HGW-Elusimicrobia-1]
MVDGVYRAFRARPLFWAAVVQITFILLRGAERIVPLPPENPPQQELSVAGKTENNKDNNQAIREITGAIADWPQKRPRGIKRFTVVTADGEKIAAFIESADGKRAETASGIPLAKGARVKLRGYFRQPRSARNPGEFDYRAYLLTRGIRRTFRAARGRDDPSAQDAEPPVKITSPAGAINSLADAVRGATLRAVAEHVPDEDSAALLSRMLIGESSDGTDGDEDLERFASLRENFALAGVAHVLVISGLHVGYVAAIFWFIFRLSGLSKTNAGALALPFIWIYALAAGGTTPVIRAAVMATSLMLSAGIGRGYDSYQALGLASIVTLSANPADLFSAGFQLSYAATFGIIHFSKYTPSFVKISNRAAAWVAGIIWMSFSAQLFTTPLVSSYFGRFSTVAFISNLAVIPAAGIALGAGIAAVIFDFIFRPAAAFCGLIASVALTSASAAVNFLSHIPNASIPVASPGMVSSIAWYSGSVFVPVFLKMKKLSAAAAIGILAVALAATPSDFWNTRGGARVTFLSSEGECALIETRDARNILIDAGGFWDPSRSAAKDSYIPFLRKKNIRELDAVFLTSPEFSRYGSLEEIIRAVRVKRVYVNPGISLWPEYFSLMEMLEEKKIPVSEIWAPWRMSAGDASIIALNPAIRRSDTSRNALALLFVSGRMKIYFTSGADEVFERRMSERINPGGGLIIKIPRSARRGVDSLFEMLRPDYAIINAKSPAAQLQRGGMIFLDDTGAAEAGIACDGGMILKLSSPPRAGKIGNINDEEKNKKNSRIPQHIASEGVIDGKTP